MLWELAKADMCSVKELLKVSPSPPPTPLKGWKTFRLRWKINEIKGAKAWVGMEVDVKCEAQKETMQVKTFPL